VKNTELIINQAITALEQNAPAEALAMLNDKSVENSKEVLFLKGEICFKLQRWGEALNHFSLFLEQSPSDKKGESYCVMIRNILGFYHKDRYNP
jgi:uncharacterized protein HemY